MRGGFPWYHEPMIESFILKEEDMPGLAFKVSEILFNAQKDGAKVVLLDGDLGTGKTTFTKELASVFGISKEKVNSPTFILKKEYKTNNDIYTKLVHVDAYRFNNPAEAKVLRLKDDLENKETIIVIEWPSKMHYVPADVSIKFDFVNEDTREITVSYDGV